MKKLILFLMTVSIILSSCTKDEIFSEQNLSSIEQEFFDLKKSLNGSFRKDVPYRITPGVIKLHQHILNENEKDNFAEILSLKVGVPYWNQAYTYKTKGEESYVLVPLYNHELGLINGYISGMTNPEGIVLNGLTRSYLLQELEVNSSVKKSVLNVMAKQEIILTGKVSPEIDNALCLLSDQINIKGIEIETSDLINDGSTPCNPELLEICIDQEGGYHWFGGIESIPLHLDHDQDGIINSEDQDWHERRFNLTQQEFTEKVLELWSLKMEDKYGPYYEFWDHLNQYEYDYENQNGDEVDLGGFFDGFDDFWDDFGDWWGDLWYDIGSGIDDFWDGVSDWFSDLFDGHIECPEWPLKEDGSIGTRTIECFTFYAWDCNENPDYNWWSFYDGYDDQAVLLNRVSNYYNNVLKNQVTFSVLFDIAVESGCDPLSSDFEHCLDFAFNNYRDDILQYFFEQQFNGTDFLPMVRILAEDCKLGEGSEGDYYSCLSSRYNAAMDNVEEYLSEIGLEMSEEEFINIYLSNCNLCNIINYADETSEILLEHLVSTEGVTKDNFSVLVELLNLDDEFGLTDDQIEDFKTEFDVDVQKINLPLKIDWTSANDQSRITQIYYCLSFIDAVYSNLNLSPVVSYKLDDFFSDFTSAYSLDIIANIKVSVLGANVKIKGKQFEIEGSKLVINEAYTPHSFYWDGNVKNSPYGNTHFYFPKTGSADWGFSILDFIIPDEEWNNFNYED